MPDSIISQFEREFASPIETSRQVNTIPERDAIPTNVRWEGMIVYVLSEKISYELRSTNLDNTGWTVYGGTDTEANHYRGLYNATTGLPAISDGTGDIGDEYLITGAASPTDVDFGSGNISLQNGDIIMYDGAVYFKKVDNNQAGAVPTLQEVLDEGNTFTKSSAGNAIDGTISFSTARGISINNSAGISFYTDITGNGDGFHAVNNDDNSTGMFINNLGNGAGIQISNTASGRGILLGAFNTGRGIVIQSDDTSKGIDLENYSASEAIRITHDSSASAFVCKQGDFGTGNFQEFQNTAETTLYKVDILGNVTGTSFIKTGGLSTEFLKANGTVDSTTYTPTTRTITAGLHLSGGGNLSANRTLTLTPLINNWVVDSQGSQRLYFGAIGNINAGVFRASDTGQEFSFRNSAGTNTCVINADTGVIQPGGYKSSDGTTGTTITFNPNTITSIVVKNGLITSVT